MLFCRPSSWWDRLDQLCAERSVSLNVAAKANSLSPQTHVVADGGIYALLGPYAISAAAKECKIRSAKVVDRVIKRHIALAMPRHGELTLACRTEMRETQAIAEAGAVGLPLT